MFTMMRYGWLIALIFTTAGLSLATAEPSGEGDALKSYIAYANQQDGPAETEISVAQASEVSEAAWTVESTGEPTVVLEPSPEEGGVERIAVTFEDEEQDILTRQAEEKLDVVVESLEFANADLRNVIRIIGERLDLNFIFDSADIEGKVTMRLRNVRLRDALNSILTSRRLALVTDQSGIFRIVPQEQLGRKEVETRTEVIQLNWVAAEDVKKTMEPFLSEDVGRLEFNEESNVVIITDVPPQIEIIRGLIAQIDMPERQVQIEARLADVNIGAIRELGTQWSATKINQDAVTRRSSSSREITSELDPVTRQSRDTLMERATENIFLGGSRIGGSETITNLFNPLDSTTSVNDVPLATAGGLVPVLLEGFGFEAGKGTLSFGDTIGIFGDTYNLNMVFTALENRNIVEILANPRVTTLNNVPALISIIEKIPYIEAVSGPSEGTLTEEIEFERAGVDIKVKPIITPNGFVRMQIELAQMIFRERVGGGALDPPAIDERKADTNVIVKTGNTVVLGGLRQQRKLEGMDGIPWLHRIPIIGWLFKEKNYNQSKTELVLMVTPKIIEEGEVVLTQREKFWYDKLEADWHLPDYFFDGTKSETDNKNEPYIP